MVFGSDSSGGCSKGGQWALQESRAGQRVAWQELGFLSMLPMAVVNERGRTKKGSCGSCCFHVL